MSTSKEQQAPARQSVNCSLRAKGCCLCLCSSEAGPDFYIFKEFLKKEYVTETRGSSHSGPFTEKCLLPPGLDGPRSIRHKSKQADRHKTLGKRYKETKA